MKLQLPPRFLGTFRDGFLGMSTVPRSRSREVHYAGRDRLRWIEVTIVLNQPFYCLLIF